jgi:hypothetical protein
MATLEGIESPTWRAWKGLRGDKDAMAALEGIERRSKCAWKGWKDALPGSWGRDGKPQSWW